MLSPRLDLRQSQALVMTPQLQQAIKLLQMSNLELVAYVERELEANPLLEAAEHGEGESGDHPGEPAVERVDGPAPAAGEAVASETPFDHDWDRYWNAEESSNGPADGGGGDAASWRSKGPAPEDPSDLEDVLVRAPTLREHLLGQLQIEIADPADRLIGIHLIDALEPTGYLGASVAAVAEQLGAPVDRVETVLARLQRFEPAGLFARGVAECLALQLEDRGQLDDTMRRLLDHLDLLARRDTQGLARLCGVAADRIAGMVALLRTLDPKPGLAFESEPIQAVTPDLLMRRSSDGGWLVEINPETLPRVLVNAGYYATLVRSARARDERSFLSDRLQSANWLIRAMHQRAITILKVASEIVRQQNAFFAHGVTRLRPLVLRDIAGAVSMHESTISRVTSNKFIQTPRGIFELKYFFTTAIPSANGNAHSAEAVRHRIRTMIEAEPHDRILSDDQIVVLLQGDGVDIARRTVAKYREAMRIPSSVARRRAKCAFL